MSSLFLRTLREDPADAEVPSHKLLVRAGYVRRVAPGIYSWLPLGLRVLRAVEQVVREEMDAIGAQEIQFPALLPREPYEATSRWTEYGPNIFRLKDRKGGDYLLGPTHEELFTLLVKGEYASYKDYPVILYQIQTKYRDEERPRAGILRGREFLMKDSYSFDLTDEGLAESYAKHRAAYIKIFDRLGLRYVIVSAMSGAMGGSASEEFLAESETGEDTFVRGPGGYAANVEAVTTPAPPRSRSTTSPPPQVHDTPDTPTIETLVAFLNAAGLGRTFTAADTLKNVLVKTRLPGADGVGAAGRRRARRPRGRHEAAGGGARARRGRAAGRGRLRGAPVPGQGLHRAGRAGRERRALPRRPAGRHRHGLGDGREQGGPPRRRPRRGPRLHPGRHDRGRRGARGRPVARRRRACWRPRAASRSGTSSSSAASTPTRSPSTRWARTASRSGSRWAPTASGSRAWSPRSPSRATTSTAWSGRARSRRSTCTWSPPGKQAEIREGAEALAAQLDAAGLRVLLDDRTASPGVKFADAELVGVPTIVVVGRGLASGVIEVKDRRTGERTEVALASAVEHLVELTGKR